MARKQVAAFGAILVALLLMTSTVHAARATQSPPPKCGCVSSFIHGNEARALRQSMARLRARGIWELKALGVGGMSRRDWANAKQRHYDCRKKRRWHYCRAAGYPCHKVCEVNPSP